MTAALLAIMWTAFVVLVLIPLATVVSVRLLAWRRIGSREGSASAYLLIVLPTVAPVLWFVSETLHESEAFLLSWTLYLPPKVSTWMLAALESTAKCICSDYRKF